MAGHILFADNNSDFLETRTEFLKREGYDVVRAANLTEAEWLLKNANIHLAILDIRMQNDDDEYDQSGLILAKEACRTIPTIILTNYPALDAARFALKQQSGGLVLSVDFVMKQEGPPALIAAVRHAFNHHVRINWDLSIDWKARDAFSLVRLIEPNLDSEHLMGLTVEFEELFRRLFYEEDQIQIERLLWERDGRLALVIVAFREGAKPESFVVTCGQHTIVNEEARSFERFAPNPPNETGTVLNAKTETIHFAINCYAFAGNDLKNIQTLSELFHFATRKTFRDTLTTLFQRTLPAWHQDKSLPEKKSLEALYRQLLELRSETPVMAYIEETIKTIESEIVTLGLRIEHDNDKVLIHFNGQSFSYADPLALLVTALGSQNSTPVICVPGILTGENILANEAASTWLTDFADAGMAPLFWNYVALEAVIRFDWVETNDPVWWWKIEQGLINSDFAEPEIRDLEPIVLKSAQAISTLRKLAAPNVGQNQLDYHIGIFFHAAHRLAEHRSSLDFANRQLSRLGHVWLAMAMISERITQEKANMLASLPNSTQELRILDEAAQLILIGDKELHLTRQSFALFKYLYGKANQVCTKEELLELLNEVFKGNYEENYLYTLARRIRQTIEEDVDNPRYLLTEPNVGYRLSTKPNLIRLAPNQESDKN
jgi:DNA-binding response OmpR family regulator